ncbi:hypothetical protein CGC20_1240 [Leishmania donovani]|uniref:Uncharacterized protein n=1 Tax=Leishmania donovani TaxID=5661 RepID=A0A504X8C5_LEIDO|nr:hypothetical protein CGC20_1240 [Leishmania donovani]
MYTISSDAVDESTTAFEWRVWGSDSSASTPVVPLGGVRDASLRSTTAATMPVASFWGDSRDDRGAAAAAASTTSPLTSSTLWSSVTVANNMRGTSNAAYKGTRAPSAATTPAGLVALSSEGKRIPSQKSSAVPADLSSHSERPNGDIGGGTSVGTFKYTAASLAVEPPHSTMPTTFRDSDDGDDEAFDIIKESIKRQLVSIEEDELVMQLRGGAASEAAGARRSGDDDRIIHITSAATPPAPRSAAAARQGEIKTIRCSSSPVSVVEQLAAISIGQSSVSKVSVPLTSASGGDAKGTRPEGRATDIPAQQRQPSANGVGGTACGASPRAEASIHAGGLRIPLPTPGARSMGGRSGSGEIAAVQISTEAAKPASSGHHYQQYPRQLLSGSSVTQLRHGRHPHQHEIPALQLEGLQEPYPTNSQQELPNLPPHLQPQPLTQAQQQSHLQHPLPQTQSQQSQQQQLGVSASSPSAAMMSGKIYAATPHGRLILLTPDGVQAPQPESAGRLAGEAVRPKDEKGTAATPFSSSERSGTQASNTTASSAASEKDVPTSLNAGQSRDDAAVNHAETRASVAPAVATAGSASAEAPPLPAARSAAATAPLLLPTFPTREDISITSSAGGADHPNLNAAPVSTSSSNGAAMSPLSRVQPKLVDSDRNIGLSATNTLTLPPSSVKADGSSAQIAVPANGSGTAATGSQGGAVAAELIGPSNNALGNSSTFAHLPTGLKPHDSGLGADATVASNSGYAAHFTQSASQPALSAPASSASYSPLTALGSANGSGAAKCISTQALFRQEPAGNSRLASRADLFAQAAKPAWPDTVSSPSKQGPAGAPPLPQRQPPQLQPSQQHQQLYMQGLSPPPSTLHSPLGGRLHAAADDSVVVTIPVTGGDGTITAAVIAVPSPFSYTEAGTTMVTIDGCLYRMVSASSAEAYVNRGQPCRDVHFVDRDALASDGSAGADGRTEAASLQPSNHPGVCMPVSPQAQLSPQQQQQPMIITAAGDRSALGEATSAAAASLAKSSTPGTNVMLMMPTPSASHKAQYGY